MDLFERSASKRPGNAVDETIEGTLERIVFSDASGEFTVVRLKIGDQLEPATAVGTLLGLPVGARLRASGYYENNPRFGRQFRIVSYTELSPQTLDGIKRYLGAGLIKGIGPEFAARIVARFGERTLEILDAHPARIREVPGIGQSRALAIQKAWSAQRGQREVMVFLQGYGVSPALAARIYKRYGSEAIQRVRENPYRLAFDVWGIGFLSADRLASALGIGRESDVRVQAGVRHVLEEAGGQGHVYLPRDRLAQDAVARLGVAVELVEPAIDRLARAGEIAIEYSDTDVAVYDTGLLRAERAAAEGLLRLLHTPSKPLPVDPESAITAYEKKAGITLAPRQAEAIRRALHEPVLVITGGPGVGKTTIVRGIVSLFLACKRSVALAAPTGRAAKRLQETTGQPAATLHRLLEWRPGEGMFGRNQSRPLEADLLVVDEASMIDIRLCADLVAALASGTRLLLVGDQDQLPSVGPGMVLRDVIASGTFPVVRLNEIFRQAAQSLIVTNAHRIHDGEIPELGSRVSTDGPSPAELDRGGSKEPSQGPLPSSRVSADGLGPAALDRGGSKGPSQGPSPSDSKAGRDFFFIEADDPVLAAQTVRDLVATRLPRYYGFSPFDIQVLTPMHKGALGAANINHLLQEALTPTGEALQSGSRMFRTGDRIMQLRNNYDKDVFNGDVGRVVRVARDAGELVASFDGREVLYESDELDELTLAYAATVHKSQGSEYAAVVIPIHTQHFVMLQRSLLYTAVTRGKKLVVLVGSRKALGLAVKNAEVAKRYSRLQFRLA
jgi:exodeoxyribonuclease V alpha subunit